jgi:hypothetical protein
MSQPFKATLSTVIRRAVEEAAADLHVAIPAPVERVDLTKGLIDAKPLPKDRVEIDGEEQVISVPVITNVPIVWPGAGGMRITFPIAIGDTVLLLFADRSLDLWLLHGGEVDPADPRRHALSDAVAIPGLRSFKAPWGGADSGAVTLGSENGAVHPAAWGDKVAEALQAIKDTIGSQKTVFDTHVHTSAAPGSPTTVPIPVASPPPPAPPGAVGFPAAPTLPAVESATVKLRG